MGKTKKLVAMLMAFLMTVGVFVCNASESVSASSVPRITYDAHLQNIGWQGWMSGGAISGTTGQGIQMEALRIKLSKNGTSMITYRAHVQDDGWLGWVQSGEIAGTTGQSRRLEGIQIKLKNEYASQYDIYYRMHIAEYGWLGWAKNGATAGSEGIGLQAEAIEIKIVKKGTKINAGGRASYVRPSLNYRAHCADVGWMSTVNEAKTAGSTGYSRRMEALIIQLKDFSGNNGIFYRAHVSDIGWQGWKTSGKMMGTTGQSRQMEAVEIKLSDSLAPCFDIYYRVHVSNVGWLGWAKNGETAGSTGQSLAIEAIQIKLELKGTSVNVGGASTYQQDTSSTSYERSKVKITTNGQTIDTFNGVSAKYITGTGNSNTGTYCCAQYVTNYYKSVYGITVANMFTGRTPTASSGYFYVTTSPQVGDIGYQLNSGNRGHWFIIKAVNGDGTYTIIEQNWKWKEGSSTYCYKNRKVSYSNTSGFKVFRWSGK